MMSRSKGFVFVFVLAFLFGIVACKAREAGVEVVESKETESVLNQTEPYITTRIVNIRSGPGTQYAIIAAVEKGTKVNVSAQEGDWLRIVSRYGRPPGYIHERYVRPSETEPNLSALGPQGSYLTTSDTNIRKGPGVDHEVVAKIAKETKVHVVGAEGDWLKVQSKHGNPPGYIHQGSVQRFDP
jgi:N-acetylmuramoyl-L-alanine amidase